MYTVGSDPNPAGKYFFFGKVKLLTETEAYAAKGTAVKSPESKK